MKEKNTLPSKGKSIFYLMLSLIATLFVSSFIHSSISWCCIHRWTTKQ